MHPLCHKSGSDLVVYMNYERPGKKKEEEEVEVVFNFQIPIKLCYFWCI